MGGAAEDRAWLRRKSRDYPASLSQAFSKDEIGNLEGEMLA